MECILFVDRRHCGFLSLPRARRKLVTLNMDLFQGGPCDLLIEMKPSTTSYFYESKGIKLFFQEWSKKSTKKVILLVHGFPGCSDHAGLLASSPLLKSCRLISFDRPGYGRSPKHSTLPPIKLAEVIENYLNEQGLTKIYILSVSGGAPYAFAIAHRLGARVERLASVAGVAPLTLGNFKFMNKKQRNMWFMRNFIPPQLLQFALNRFWQRGLDQIDQMLFTAGNTLSREDQKVFQHATIGPALAETLKTALNQGPAGLLFDMKVYSRPWGFALKSLDCPVTLWHGLQDDVVHPKFAIDMHKKLRKAKLILRKSEGHYSLPMNYRDPILKDLIKK